MDHEQINQRCVELFQQPRVKLRMWNPRMFWNVGKSLNPGPDELTEPKVDLHELEVLLATAAHEPPQCAEAINQRQPGRAEFIMRMARGGGRPLLMPA